jgi:hypothetical protein
MKRAEATYRLPKMTHARTHTYTRTHKATRTRTSYSSFMYCDCAYMWCVWGGFGASLDASTVRGGATCAGGVASMHCPPWEQRRFFFRKGWTSTEVPHGSSSMNGRVATLQGLFVSNLQRTPTVGISFAV